MVAWWTTVGVIRVQCVRMIPERMLVNVRARMATPTLAQHRMWSAQVCRRQRW